MHLVSCEFINYHMQLTCLFNCHKETFEVDVQAFVHLTCVKWTENTVSVDEQFAL